MKPFFHAFPRKFTCLLTAVIGLLSNGYGQPAQRLRFDHLSVTDGLSQMSVVTIHQDAEGFLWFGTRDGLNRYDGYEFRVFRHELHDTTSISDSYIRCMADDFQGGGLWIGTANGLNRYDPRTGRFTRHYIDRERHTGIVNEINAICPDPHGGVWIGTYEGLYHLDGKPSAQAVRYETVTQRIYSLASDGERLYIGHDRGLATLNADGTLRHIIRNDRKRAVNLVHPDSEGHVYVSFANTGTLGILDPETGAMTEHTIIADDSHRRSNLIRSMAVQSDGRLVLGTYDGLRIYDPEKGVVESYNQTSQESGGLSHYAVETVYIDRARTLWVGTYAGGVNYAHAQSSQFSYYDPRRGNHTPGVLSAIVAEPSGKVLWIGTDAGGVLRFDVATRQFDYYPCTTDSGDLFKDNNVKSLLLDGPTLYVGLYTGQLHTLDIRSRHWTGMVRNPEHTAIYSLAKMNDTLLLGTYSSHGLKYLSPKGIENRDLPSEGQTVNITQISVLCPTDDALWIGTRSRGLYRYRRTGELDRYTSDLDNAISGNRITVIFEDSRKRVLIGTSDGGLNIFDPTTERFTTLTHKDGLHDDMICSVVEDRSGRLWIVTRTGISELDATNRVLRTYDHSSGIRVQEFSPAAAFVTPDNTIWVGGDNGMVSFNPDNLQVNTYAPPVVITSVSVNNRPIGPDFGKVLRLKHNEGNLTFSFRALNYIYPERNAYAYKLEGADNEWREVGSVREVNYANLAPGHYHFRVRGSNNDGIWSETDAGLDIEIASPVWLRWWAVLIYLLLAVTVAVLIYRYARERRRLRQHVMLKQKHEELYKARIELFTNFAHELRTPLTLILSPLEEMLSPDHPQEPTHESLQMMYANAKRMLLVINQLMDLRRKEAGSMSPKVAEGDFAGFAEEIFIAFNHQARKHRIDYRFSFPERPLMLWYDRWLFEKVLLNLLSNAFKFTPDEGHITLAAEQIDASRLPERAKRDTGLYPGAESYLHLTLTDDGIGMDPRDLERIFDPFYRVSEIKSIGTGIGLSLVKGIVEMHHGVIWAESEKGHGSTFHAVIPCGNAHFRPEEIISGYLDSETLERYTDDVTTPEPESAEAPDERHSDVTILLVEDNRQLRTYIHRRLSPYWKVIEADNGRTGQLLALEKMPSLIISDVMMPVMDGLQMCYNLKHDTRTAHIPIVLLTARQFVLQIKEGLEFGADDYITKPFHMQALILKIRNIIASREKLKELYGQKLSLENLGVEIHSGDDKFLQQLNQAIDQNIADPTLNLDTLCQQIGMSRASLYRKLMAATGLSPARYIQSVRLNLAAKMLRETRMSVSEIATAAGFNSLIHFSASFRKQYGVPPSRYAAESSDRKESGKESPGTNGVRQADGTENESQE